jgi:hypothetical protein
MGLLRTALDAGEYCTLVYFDMAVVFVDALLTGTTAPCSRRARAAKIVVGSLMWGLLTAAQLWFIVVPLLQHWRWAIVAEVRDWGCDAPFPILESKGAFLGWTPCGRTVECRARRSARSAPRPPARSSSTPPTSASTTPG